jgi:hypothetical protein
LWCPNRPALAVEALTQIARAAVRVVHFILRFSLTFSGSEREELRSRTARRLLIGTREVHHSHDSGSTCVTVSSFLEMDCDTSIEFQNGPAAARRTVGLCRMIGFWRIHPGCRT